MNMLTTSKEIELVIKDVLPKIIQTQLIQWPILRYVQRTFNTHVSHKYFLKMEEKGPFSN